MAKINVKCPTCNSIEVSKFGKSKTGKQSNAHFKKTKKTINVINTNYIEQKEAAYEIEVEVISYAQVDTLIYMERNKYKKPYPKLAKQMIFKIRRRIETTFSQLTQQLNTEVVKSKSF